MRKKIILVMILILLSLFLGYTYLNVPSSLTGATIVQPKTFIQSEGSIQVYFCPQDNCEQNLIDFLSTAKMSIHCAVFELDLKSVQDLILDKAKTMEVEVVTDDQYLKEFDHPFVKTDRSGLMHNKFCIVDGEKVYAGSMNPTNNCANKNNNNLLLIRSKQLATNYEMEFQEMWNGTFKKGNPVLNPQLRIGNISVDNYFCPDDQCAEQVKLELQKAQQEIYFMTFSFTHEGIGNMLLLKKRDGLTVRGVMEARQITKNSQYSRLVNYNIPVRKDGNPNNMHHKVFIIDNSTVITGSFNPSEGGDTRNDENILIIHDREIASRFLGEFEKVWGEGQS